MPYPQINELAPAFTETAVVEGGVFKQISLSDYRGKYVVLIFYPMDFTFVCPTEINSFSDRIQEFEQEGASVIACSTDSKYTHLAWIHTPREEGGLSNLKIPLLADKSMSIAKNYGVLDEKMGIAFRGLFIIDRTGILRQITVNDISVGRSVDETLRLLQACIHTDTHGDACPIDWKPGKKTIKKDSIGSKEYFKSLLGEERRKDKGVLTMSSESFRRAKENGNIIRDVGLIRTNEIRLVTKSDKMV